MGQGSYIAEFGRPTGGSVNMVLRSGANLLHADGFYYYRDQDFGARDPLATIKLPSGGSSWEGRFRGPFAPTGSFTSSITISRSATSRW